ncbi:MAG: ComEC/Rec2 family competence protein [Minisyncoccota bacterium]
MAGFEIDYLPVGTGERSGDAIAMRFWNDAGNQNVFIIDGGTQDAGKALVEHVRTRYGTEYVDAVISTHPDGDHASGLSVVMEELNVRNLLMHLPWNHADAVKHLFEDRALTITGIRRNIRKELKYARDLHDIAVRKKIPIHEPFSGVNGWDGLMHVLGPSPDYYRALVASFDCTPELDEPLLPGLLQQSITKSQEVEWVNEDWLNRTLEDGTDRFSPENSSSAIIFFSWGTDTFLFTGDADELALEQAVVYANSQKMDLGNLHLLHVPHHGSKRNVGPTILSKIRAKKAQISAGPAAPKHPSYAVVNELIRNNATVYTTRGNAICHHSIGAPVRTGWGPAPVETFAALVQK